MGSSERRKGIVFEREVATVLRSHGLEADRTVQNAGVYLRGDLTGVAGYHFECKRQEVLRLPTWIRQATDECGDAVPVVVFRQNRGEAWAAIQLEQLARLLSITELRLARQPGDTGTSGRG